MNIMNCRVREVKKKYKICSFIKDKSLSTLYSIRCTNIFNFTWNSYSDGLSIFFVRTSYGSQITCPLSWVLSAAGVLQYDSAHTLLQSVFVNIRPPVIISISISAEMQGKTRGVTEPTVIQCCLSAAWKR
jgi:hypothetical protein